MQMITTAILLRRARHKPFTGVIGEPITMRYKFDGLRYRTALAILGLIFVPLRLAWAQSLEQTAQLIDSLQELPVGLGILPKPEIPADNPQSPQKAALGERLFFNKDLSGDYTMS